MRMPATRRVRELANFVKGRKPSCMFKEQVADSLPYVLIENFGGQYTSYTNDSGCMRCFPDDTLVVSDGANAGLVSTSHEGYIGSTLGALRPQADRVDPKYLFYFLKSRFSILNTVTRGAAVPHLDKDLLMDLEMPLPHRSEQRRIVQELDGVEALLKLRARSDELSSAVTAAIFYDLFLRQRDKREWPVRLVEQVVTGEGAIRTGPFGSHLLHSEFTKAGIPVLGIDNVVENEFRWVTERYISKEKYETLRRFRVFPGDVMVTIMGTIGRCCVAPPDLPVCISTKHICVLTLDRSLMDPYYLWGALLFDGEVRSQMRAAGGGAVMEGLNSTIIRQLGVRVPPIDLQGEFSLGVDQVCRLRVAQTLSAAKLGECFQALLQDAFPG